MRPFGRYGRHTLEGNVGRVVVRVAKGFTSLGVLAGGLLLAACGAGSSESTGAGSQSLSADQLAVLGFERPTTDWSSPSGSLGSSSVVSQGSAALSVQPMGWTEINSVLLSSLGPVQSTLKVDLRLPAAATWGDARVVLVAPSRGLHWAELGIKQLTQLPAGQFSTLSFPLPPSVESALEGTYTDLRIKVILNGPAFGSPYVFDNIVLAESGGGGAGGAGGTGGGGSGGSGAGNTSGGSTSSGGSSAGSAAGGTSSVNEISATIPLGETRGSMLLSATDYLAVDDRVEIGLPGQFLNVAGLGTPGVQFGSSLKGHNNTFSAGNVGLRSQSTVDGFVRAEGIIDKQDSTVRVLGAEQPGHDVPPRTLRWKVEFPEASAPLALVGQGTDLFLDPGSYQDLNVHGGGRVHLRTGTYFLRSFSTEPQGQVIIENDDGPVFIYVRNSFTYKGPFVDDAHNEGQVLVGYLGSSVALLQAPFVGTMVAPNAKIDLERPNGAQHRGSWFAKELHVFSDSTILGLPFDWSALPPVDEPPDTDGDGVIDRLDGCPLDPDKVEPKYCGCNRPETDDDEDELPNCVDACPQDPDNTTALSCGCLNEENLQPAGKPCVVEACSGSKQVAACDGEGHCAPAECEPMPGCFWRVFGDSLYWFCNAQVTWEAAEEACGQEPYRYLTKVDGATENRWLLAVSEGDAWLGGNDLSETEIWRWSNPLGRDGQPFWLNGLPVPARYTKWSGGAPAFGHCLALGSDGLWSDDDCGTLRGFICEQPLLHVPYVPPGPSIDDFYPGTGGGEDDEDAEPDDGSADCVENSDEFPSGGTDAENRQAMVDIGNECLTKCPTEDAVGCIPDQHCTGFAAPPLPGADRCTLFRPQAKASCDLLTIDESQSCTLEDPTCTGGLFCGRRIECAALDANFQAKECEDNGDCPAGQQCGKRVKVCIDPSLHSACDIKSGDACVGQCFGSLACGTVEPDCAASDDDDFRGLCSRTRLCPEPDTLDMDTDPLTDPESNLTEQLFPAETFFPDPEQFIDPFPSAKPENCGGDNEPDCEFVDGKHPWCNYTLDTDDENVPEPREVSDSSPAFGDKRGGSGNKPRSDGKAGPISFDFDPNLTLSYDIEQPLPLGDSEFRAYAAASATASAHFALFGINGDVSILDALGSLEVKRCGLVTDARLKLFGHDFLPAILGDNYEHLDDLDTPEDIRDTCTDAIEAFQLVVDRAQKALRDAQELIRQQKDLVAAGKRFSPTLCEELLADGVPANFPTADAPFTGCGDLSPEDTINLFIRYYEQQVNELITSQAAMMLPASNPAGSLPEFPELEISFLNVGSANGGDTIDEDSRRETQEIANIQFAIGPVPVNLTVDAFVNYGIEGSLRFGFNPMGLLDVYRNDGRPLNEKTQELAYADASITPFAGAGASLFIGVGFSFGGLTAKLGIAGDVTLGNVSLPIYARAGLKVTPEVDERGLPTDMAGMVDSAEMLFPAAPPLKYRYDAFYKFGASASIQDILQGTIYAKLKISFFWFSKTWTKTIVSFDSPFDDINLDLISGGDGLPFAESSGKMGAVGQPVPFVKFKPLETPGPLPPLPDGTGGTGGGGGGNGGAGTGGSSGSGSGARPPVSLLVAGDPRYVGFDTGRAQQLFYDGFCACSGDGSSCTSDLGCCDGTTCVENDDLLVPNASNKCLTCVPPPEQGRFAALCDNSDECCDSGNPSKPNVCYPMDVATADRKYCRECVGDGGTFIDVNPQDGQPDYGECCPDTHPLDPITPGRPSVCTICQSTGEDCNVGSDCCPVTGFERFCDAQGQCNYRVPEPG